MTYYYTCAACGASQAVNYNSDESTFRVEVRKGFFKKKKWHICKDCYNDFWNRLKKINLPYQETSKNESKTPSSIPAFKYRGP